MSGRWLGASLAVLLACFPGMAYPQLGEVQLGPVVNYGGPAPYRLGGGLALGLAAGRLSYVGLRWTYQTGSTRPETTLTAPVDVRSRVQIFTFDFGPLIPVGRLDLVPGGSVGVAWFAQRTDQPAEVSQHAVEFVAGPSLALQAHLFGLVFIPELQYQWSGSPGLPWPVSHQGPVGSLRIVVPFEVDRIRY